MSFPKLLALVTSLCILSANINAQTDDAVGRILITKGNIEASDSQGNYRVLKRRSEIFVGDKIITGADGFAQIRMKDSAIIAIKENSELTIQNLDFDGEGGKPDTVIMALHKGGLRTIAGLIGTGDDDEYRLITPDVDITPFGVTYECILVGGKTLCGVSHGSIKLTNSTGSLQLGIGGNYDFAEANDRQSPVEGLITRPAALGQTTGNNQAGIQSSAPSPRPQPTVNSPASPANNISFPAPATITLTPYKKSPQ